MDFMGIKRSRILRRLQTYKLTLVTKGTYKKLFKKKEFFTTQGAPCVQRKIFILEYLFLGAFCHKGKFIFLKSTKKSTSFYTNYP
jgi:hypothetical protein